MQEVKATPSLLTQRNLLSHTSPPRAGMGMIKQKKTLTPEKYIPLWQVGTVLKDRMHIHLFDTPHARYSPRLIKERKVGQIALEFLIYFSQHLFFIFFSFSAHLILWPWQFVAGNTHFGKNSRKNSTGHQWNHREQMWKKNPSQSKKHPLDAFRRKALKKF